jgi:hypothetical protein
MGLQAWFIKLILSNPVPQTKPYDHDEAFGRRGNREREKERGWDTPFLTLTLWTRSGGDVSFL